MARKNQTYICSIVPLFNESTYDVMIVIKFMERQALCKGGEEEEEEKSSIERTFAEMNYT